MGAQLPGARELASQVGVNYHTVGKAYQELESQGLIERQRGGPYRVANPGSGDLARAELRQRLESLVGEIRLHGIPAAEASLWWTEALNQEPIPPSSRRST